MSDEAEAGLSDEPAGLDAIIDGAIEQAEAPEASPDTPEPKSGERPRDPKGRFAPKDTAEAASEPEQAKPATTDAPTIEAQPAQQPVEAPHTWSADEKAQFAQWPRNVQEAVVARYKAMEADYTRKTQAASEAEKSAAPFLQAIKPFESYLAEIGPRLGQTPPQLIAGLAHAAYILDKGPPEQKYAAFQQMAQRYGVDLAALAGGQIPQIDPALHQLRQELDELRGWKSQFEQTTQIQQAEHATVQIEAFATAKTESGQPKYPHFERVKPLMAHYLANGEARTLDDAYAKASQPIQDAIAEGLKRSGEAADAQRKAAVEKAQKAAPVKSSGSQPGGGSKGKGLDSILDDAISKANIG